MDNISNKVLVRKDSGLRVLMVTPRYFPFMGGVETHIFEVGKRLTERGVNVTVLTTDPSHQLPAEQVQKNIKVKRVPAWPKKRDYYFAPGILKIIAQDDWDIIHFQGCHTFVPLLGMWAAWQAKKPFVLTFHTGGHSESWRNAIRNLQWSILRPLLTKAQRLIGVSRFEAEFFQKQLHLPAKKFAVVPNGGRLPEIVSEVKTDPTLIVSPGRLERYKGHHRIIQAMPLILEREPKARLLILGAGPYEAELRCLAETLGVSNFVEIRSIPPTERREMAKTLSQAGLVVLMSEYEAHPVAVMEALALKRSVLVAATSGLQELAEQGLVRSIPLQSQSHELAKAVLEQLASPLQVVQDLELPTWETCTEQLLSIYREIMPEKLSCAS